MRLNVLHQASIRTKDLGHRLHLSFTIVPSNMAGQLLTLNEGFGTVLPFVRFSRVRSNVDSQPHAQTKALGTLLALVRSFACVRLNLPCQSSSTAKGLGT